jgi:hypothetical protein
MSSSSSSPSSSARLIEQRKQLLSEQQKVQKDIQRLKLRSDGLEHDIQVARTAFSVGESPIVSRTRKLAALFGGMLRSDEELIERIQDLLQSLERDQALAVELGQEIERCGQAKQKEDDHLDETHGQLRRQRQVNHQKQEEKQNARRQLAHITESFEAVQLQKAALLDKITPIARLLNCRPESPEFTRRLRDRVAQPDLPVERLLRDVADTAQVDSADIELPKLLDSLAFRYKKLVEQSEANRELEQHVKTKLRQRRAEISDRKMRIQALQESVRCAEQELQAAMEAERGAAQSHERQLNAVKRAECRELRAAAKAAGISDAPHEVGPALAQKLREQVRLFRQMKVIREQRRIELTEGIHVVQEATHAISRANVRLIHELRSPS